MYQTTYCTNWFATIANKVMKRKYTPPEAFDLEARTRPFLANRIRSYRPPYLSLPALEQSEAWKT